MAFRTAVGQDYKAKNALDSFIERQEERSRTSKRIESSLAHNAAQAAVLASDAVTRGLHKGWVMAQKGAWAVKQMQLEAELAASGSVQGMQIAGAPQRQERAKFVVEPLQPISLQTVRQVGPMVTVKWTTKLFAGSARNEALLSITQAQVMVDGKFRPQTFPLGLHENGERKLELTVDVGEPGERALQIRQLDNEKWSRWSEAYAVQVSKSSTPSTKLLKKKTTAKAETGFFSRALSTGGAPLFLATLSQEGNPLDNMTSTPTLKASEGAGAPENENSGKYHGSGSSPVAGRPEKEDAYAEKGKELPSKPAGAGSAEGTAPKFGRTTSAPAAPAWLLRRSGSMAPAPLLLDSSLDTTAQSVLDQSVTSSLEMSPAKQDATPKAAANDSQEERIAPSRAKAGATATFSRSLSAPTIPSPNAKTGPAKTNVTEKPRVPTPPTEEREGGFGRTGSAARAAAAGIARFRRAASKVNFVLRVASGGKDGAAGQKDEEKSGGEIAKDDLHIKSADRRDGVTIFGFKRAMSAPSCPLEDGFARTTSDAAKNTAPSAFARLRDLPVSAKENASAGLPVVRPESPQEQTVGIEVHLTFSVAQINGIKEAQIKSAVAAMVGVNCEVLVVEGLENAWSGSRMHLCLTIPKSDLQKVRLRMNLDRLNLELKRSNLPNAKGIKEEKPGFKVAPLKRRHTTGVFALPEGGLAGMEFSEFNKLMGNEEPSQMSLIMEVIAPKIEVMLMYDSLQEGILETTALNKWPRSSVRFVSHREVKGTRLQPSKVVVSWSLEAPARARDMMLAAMEDSQTGLRRWAEKKGLPLVKVVELTITDLAKPVSRFKRAATKIGIANSFLATAKRNLQEAKGEFTRSTSAPGFRNPESEEFDRSPESPEIKAPELGGFKRTPSAPDAVGTFTPSKPDIVRPVDTDLCDSAGIHGRGASIVEPMITSPGITTRINPNNLSIIRTPSGGVYVHPAAEKPRTSTILPFFSRAESVVKSEIAYESDYFSRVPSGATEEAGGRGFSRASSAEKAAGFFRQVSQGVLNVFTRATSSTNERKTGSGEDKFSRAGSSGDDKFSRAGSAARSDAIFSRLGSAASGETIFGANSLGDVAQRSTFDRREELHTDGIITIPPPSVHTDSALKAEDEGPRTPIMHIEPRRLGIKKAYQKPSQSATGSGIKRVVKPKSSGGAADDFESAPSLTTLAPPKPKTAPKEQSQAALEAKRVHKTRRRTGYAAHTWSSGEMYEGEWKDGVMHGKGLYRYADDHVDENQTRASERGLHRYEGEFSEGKFNGKGLKHSQNGDRYEGDFKDGKFHGKGVFFCKNTGETYQGGFWKGRFHGRGVQISQGGTRLSVLHDAKRDNA